MRPSSTDNKPLLLIFPSKQEENYLRCIAIADYLKRFFTISFLHNNQFASYIYQQGFDTFSCLTTIKNPTTLSDDSFTFPRTHFHQVEAVFLDQVQLLETLQPALILGDQVPTLSMVSEYTGIPFIALRSATDNSFHTKKESLNLFKINNVDDINHPYTESFINETAENNKVIKQQPFKEIRDRYGLQEKNNSEEEWEGTINWIYDLPELFPLQELTYLYENIGPLYPTFFSKVFSYFNRINPIKKTIIVTMGDDNDAWQRIEFLKEEYYRKYNVIAIGDNKSILNAKHIFSYPLEAMNEQLSKADLLICRKRSPFLYQALLNGIPTLYTLSSKEKETNFGILQQQQLGAYLNTTESNSCKAIIDHWVEQKNSDAHRNMQYVLNANLGEQSRKIECSLFTHFPFLQRHSIAK